MQLLLLACLTLLLHLCLLLIHGLSLLLSYCLNFRKPLPEVSLKTQNYWPKMFSSPANVEIISLSSDSSFHCTKRDPLHRVPSFPLPLSVVLTLLPTCLTLVVWVAMNIPFLIHVAVQNDAMENTCFLKQSHDYEAIMKVSSLEPFVITSLHNCLVLFIAPMWLCKRSLLSRACK